MEGLSGLRLLVPPDPTESGGRLSVRKEAAPESWSFLAGLPRVAGARRAGCLPAEIWGRENQPHSQKGSLLCTPESDTSWNGRSDLKVTDGFSVRWPAMPMPCLTHTITRRLSADAWHYPVGSVRGGGGGRGLGLKRVCSWDDSKHPITF